MTTADVVILGGGPGGYAAAIRSAQLGRSVVLIDEAFTAEGAPPRSDVVPRIAVTTRRQSSALSLGAGQAARSRPLYSHPGPQSWPVTAIPRCRNT